MPVLLNGSPASSKVKHRSSGEAICDSLPANGYAAYFFRTSVKLAKGDSAADLSRFWIVQDHLSVSRS